MHRAHLPLPRLFLASAIALSALPAAPALAEPAAPAPVPQDAARDAASGQTSGKRMHKPYTVTTSAAQSDSCAAPNVQPVNVASDPEEGGQIARTSGQKVKVSDMTVTKKVDKASTTLAESSTPGSACR